ncbi:MAG TPA: hypothetical protein VJK03_01050 [Candidatus Nanoarchaeia archaeon]|nr:hypothetical protein [Candidatus Nanoarchaeia archaeon]
MKDIVCLGCSSNEIIRRGTRESKGAGKNQRYECKNCRYRFSVYNDLWEMKKYEKQTINDSNSDKKINFELTPKERINNLIIPNLVDEDLAYFCGILAGDGSIRYQKEKGQYEVHCAGNPKDEKEFYNEIVVPLIKKLFNLDVKPKYLDKAKIYGIDICSKNIVKYLNEFIGLPLGNKYDSLHIPKIFINDKIFVRNFICGLADTDFHLQIKRGYYPVIKGVSKSESFIKEIRMFLEQDGFKVCNYKRQQFDERVNKTIITYSIELSGYKQFIPWMEKIGFRHPKNKDKIENLVSYYRENK